MTPDFAATPSRRYQGVKVTVGAPRQRGPREHDGLTAFSVAATSRPAHTVGAELPGR